MPKRRCWNPLERERDRAQTMRNRSQKTAETLLLDPTKNKEKTCEPPGQTQEKGVWDAQQVLCPSHCETVAGKMPKRRCWNPLERRKYMPKPCETAARKRPKRCFWNLRKMPKRCIWNLLKTKKGCLKQGKPLRNVRLGSLQATRPNSRQGVWDAHAKRQNPSRFCAQAIAKPQPEKCRNVAVGTH